MKTLRSLRSRIDSAVTVNVLTIALVCAGYQTETAPPDTTTSDAVVVSTDLPDSRNARQWGTIYFAYAVPFCCLLSFGQYWFDKVAARRGAYRVSEQQLHTIDLCGGWPAGLLARHLFRHKTKKTSFIIGFWLTVTANIVMVVLFFKYLVIHL